MNDLVGSQAGAVGDAQGRLILEATGGLQQAGHLFETQDNRYLAWFVDVAHPLHELGMFEGGLEEEPESGDGGVQMTARHPLFDQVQLIPSQILSTCRIRRLAEKAGEVFDDPEGSGLGLGGEFAHRHVFGHALA